MANSTRKASLSASRSSLIWPNSNLIAKATITVNPQSIFKDVVGAYYKIGKDGKVETDLHPFRSKVFLPDDRFYALLNEEAQLLDAERNRTPCS